MHKFTHLIYILLVFSCFSYPESKGAEKHDVSRKETPGIQTPVRIKLSSKQRYFLHTDQLSDTAEMVVSIFLGAQKDSLGLAQRDIEEFMVSSSYVSSHNGMRHFYAHQKINGIEVAKAEVQVHVASDGQVVSAHSSFVPRLGNSLSASKPSLTPGKAVLEAVKFLELGDKEPEMIEVDENSDDQHTVLSGEGLTIGPISATLAYVMVRRGELRLSWHFLLELLDSRYVYDTYVDAVTGEVLALNNMVVHETYNVYPSPVQDPGVGGRSLVVDPYTNSPSSASPYGWHDTDGSAGAEYTITRGNNAHAYEDSANSNSSQGNEPDGGAGLNFDFSIDLTLEPNTYMEASVANLFYWNNLLHDVHYEYGFDEAAGNFQANNYGNGGLGNDYVRAEGQDGGGVNNANMYTPADGSLPRMQMYLGDNVTPKRDGSLDNQVVVHEYGHGVSQRLTGGPNTTLCLNNSQSSGMGEGWSDWWGLVLTTTTNDDRSLARPIGTWLFGQATNGPGIRPYPYSTDMSVDPHTFGDIRSGLSVPHGVGTVWCVALWDLFWNLVDVYGYDADVYKGTGGNNIAMQLIMDGLKLQPCEPTFLDARDAILEADRVNNGGVNQTLLWETFARRGMGFSADDGGSASTLSVTEAFDVPDDLLISPNTDLISSGQEGGPFTPPCQTYTLVNMGSNAVTWIALHTSAWVTISLASETLNPGATSSVDVCIDADALSPGEYSDTVSFTNTLSGFTHTRNVQLRITTVASMPFTEDFENGALDTFWVVTGTEEYRTQVTSLNTPHDGTYHLLMDDHTDASEYSRNEVTLNIDLQGWENVEMRFWAKDFNDENNGPPATPFTNGADFDGVAISEDGVNWYEVQDLRTSISFGYQELVVDLDAEIAAHGLSYNSSFNIRFNQYDNYSVSTDGIAIDTISILGEYKRAILISMPEELYETDGVLTNSGLATLTKVFSSNLTVSLTSDDTTEIQLPSNLVFAAGETSKTFDVTVVDDTGLDGSQVAVITASALMHQPGMATSTVHDSESGILSLLLPASAIEGQGQTQGLAQTHFSVDDEVVVMLKSDDSTEAIPEATVTIPAGTNSATFNLTIVDDTIIDSAQTISIIASVTNWSSGVDTIEVLDNEDRNLRLSFSESSVEEGNGFLSGFGEVALSGSLTYDLFVSLSSDDMSELLVSTSVIIPAGEQQAAFDVAVVDDAIADGQQIVNVSASAPAFSNDVEVLPVSDNEVSHFLISAIATTQYVGAPFQVTISARDINGAVISNFWGGAALSANGSTGNLLMTPTLLVFSNGQFMASVSINELDTNVTLRVDDGLGHTGTSNPFDVLPFPVPVPLHPVIPLGSLVYSTNFQAVLLPMVDEQAYSIDLDENQTLSIIITPEDTFQPVLEVKDDSFAVMTNLESQTVAERILLQALPIANAGTYTFWLSGKNNSYGSYTFEIFLNTLLEEEEYLGLSNNTYQTAQDIDNSFISLGDGLMDRRVIQGIIGISVPDADAGLYTVDQIALDNVDIYAETGSGLASSNDLADWYAVSLEMGVPVTFLTEAENNDDFLLELYDQDGTTLLASGISTAEIGQVVKNYRPSSSGKYYARVSGGNDKYSLVITQNAEFDLGNNHSFSNPQSLNTITNALGYIHAFDTDVYSIYLESGDAIEAFSYTPGDGPYEFENSLNPDVELYDPYLTLIGDSNPLTNYIRNAGTYYIMVSGKSGSTGAYLLQADLNDDVDEDGVNNRDDNCPEDFNPTQEDGDVDGRGDVCDDCQNSYVPSNLVRAFPGQVIVASDPAGQNSPGERVDIVTLGSFAETREECGFGRFGKVYVNFDDQHLYLGGSGLDTIDPWNVGALFLAVGSMTQDVVNLWNANGMPNTLDFLHNVGFEQPMDMAIILGDEYGDGQYPDFNMSSGDNLGQGVFLLDANFTPVNAAQLAQFDGAEGSTTGSQDDDGNRLTDQWEVAIPWTALNATNLYELGSLHLAGLLLSPGVNGNDRYISGNYIGEFMEALNGVDAYTNIGFGFASLDPIEIDIIDADGDGLPNQWEDEHFGGATNALPTLDSDGDGQSNYQEYIAGTEPQNSTNYFYISIDREGDHQVSVPESVIGRKYTIEHSTTLILPQWFKVFTNLNGSGFSIILTNQTTNATDYYRGAVEFQ